ncbi:MAG: hypothetical protein RL662_1683, partial [Bacteroidota bacterium]
SFILFSISIQTQNIPLSLRSSIKDDVRKDLLKQISPSLDVSHSHMRQSHTPSKAVREESLEEYNKRIGLKSGGAEFEDRYKISPHVTKYSSSTSINKLPDGYVVPVFTGGHWIFANPTTRVDGLVVPSGLDLSGGGKKKMSAKAKAILEHVFGIKPEE